MAIFLDVCVVDAIFVAHCLFFFHFASFSFVYVTFSEISFSKFMIMPTNNMLSWEMTQTLSNRRNYDPNWFLIHVAPPFVRCYTNLAISSLILSYFLSWADNFHIFISRNRFVFRRITSFCLIIRRINFNWWKWLPVKGTPRKINKILLI